jgi:hypothetical protein
MSFEIKKGLTPFTNFLDIPCKIIKKTIVRFIGYKSV